VTAGGRMRAGGEQVTAIRNFYLVCFVMDSGLAGLEVGGQAARFVMAGKGRKAL